MTMKVWQEWRDSNPRPAVLETAALPTELHSYALLRKARIASAENGDQGKKALVEIGGFEPPTSAMRTQRSPN
jgi:hypothetical protein